MSKKLVKTAKRALGLIFAFLLSIESFASVVSDNNGSAFITKSEFEELKKDFAGQLDQYNTSMDGKIDGAIALYLSGITLAEKIEQTSILNQLSQYKFSRAFNYFGDSTWSGTRLSEYYKYWSYYGGTWGIDTASVGNNVNHYMVGIRGGTGVTNISEKTVGTDMCQFVVCNNGNFDKTEPTPAYGMSSYNYYSMMWLSSNYGTLVGSSWNSSFYQSLTGELTGTQFGTRFWTVAKPNTPPNAYGANIAASIMFSCTPVDQVASSYNADWLPGLKMDESDICYYIMSDDLMKLGDADGTFLSNTNNENAYWRMRAGRSYNTAEGTLNLYITKYKRKYQEMYWKDIVLDNVSLKVNKESYYYNGLPVFTASNDGVVTIKIKPVNTAGAITAVAISEEPFKNEDLVKGISGVADHNCNFTDWEMTSGTEYVIKFRVKKDKTYWLKAAPLTTNNATQFTTSSIIIETE